MKAVKIKNKGWEWIGARTVTLLGNKLKTARPTFQQDHEIGVSPFLYFSLLTVISSSATRDNPGLIDHIELGKCSIIQTKKKAKQNKQTNQTKNKAKTKNSTIKREQQKKQAKTSNPLPQSQ